MKLTAKLTIGWKDDIPPGLTAKKLHEEAIEDANYAKCLSDKLTQNITSEIYQLEQLFRKSTLGFQPLKQFVGTLTTLEFPNSFSCYIDAFAYSFLKGAKNFDLLLPLDPKQDGEFITKCRDWSQDIKNLEIFERFGRQKISTAQKKQYLALRQIVSKASVRDEIRILATLLVSGSSTLEQVSQDLGLNYTLGQRTVGVFESIGVVSKRRQEVYTISSEALPVVIFCLREIIGLDLLSNLDIPGK